MKKILSVVLALMLLAMMAVPAMAEDFTIVVNLKTLSSEYWQTVKSGIDKAAEELGLTIDVQGPPAESDIQGQVNQIETQLTGNPDAIIIAPDDNDAVVGVLESTGYQGIVVFCDTTNTFENQTAFVGTSNDEAAYGGGVYGAAINGADTKALIIYGQEGDNTSNLRKSGYEKALEEAGLTPVAEMSGNNNTADSKNVMEAQLISNPDINLVLCHNDDSALGALEAIKEAGKEGIAVIGFDGNTSALESIAAGELKATIAQQPAEMGYLSVMTAVAALKGETVEKVVSVPTVVIDAENVAEHLQ
ncbi:MAG: sugar ABC transporter substrate-binding protein [Clostridia bacterium]|nr:sugar ABC transporter substrate-binding protein [Clostridia bacterium]